MEERRPLSPDLRSKLRVSRRPHERQRHAGSDKFRSKSLPLLVTRNASQWTRAPGAVRGNGFVRRRIKLAGVCVPLDCGVELLRVENLVPGTKPRQLGRGKLRNGFFDVFGSRHPGNIALARAEERGGIRRRVPAGVALGRARFGIPRSTDNPPDRPSVGHPICGCPTLSTRFDCNPPMAGASSAMVCGQLNASVVTTTRAGPDASCKLREVAIVPLICPGVSNVLRYLDTIPLLCMGLFSIFWVREPRRPLWVHWAPGIPAPFFKRAKVSGELSGASRRGAQARLESSVRIDAQSRHPLPVIVRECRRSSTPRR